MNKKNNMIKITQKISLLLAIAVVVFGLGVGTANAALSVTTLNATNINSSNAVLNGSAGFVSGDNAIVTAYFEWGTSTNFTNAITQSYYGNNIGNYRTTIGGLNSNTVYYFRAVAKNSQGKVYGNILSFRTRPSSFNTNNGNQVFSAELKTNINTATNISSTGAQLNGLVTNQEVIPSNTHFEWGANYNLISRTRTISTGAFPVVKHINKLSGLSPNTTYYFRIVADNGLSRSVSDIGYFTTKPASITTSVSNTSKKSQPKTTTVDTSDKQLETNLAASVIGADFLPDSLFDWLLLMIFTLVLILLVQYLFIPADVKQGSTE